MTGERLRKAQIKEFLYITKLIRLRHGIVKKPTRKKEKM